MQSLFHTLSLTKRLQGRLVSQRILAGLHDQRETRVDGVDRLFLITNHVIIMCQHDGYMIMRIKGWLFLKVERRLRNKMST
jgi:hypothetical protein